MPAATKIPTPSHFAAAGDYGMNANTGNVLDGIKVEKTVEAQNQLSTRLDDLNKRLGSAIMLITHDLGVVAEMCERVVVMYAGRKVE